VTALLELAAEREAGLLVFGPDLSLTPRRRFRAAAAAGAAGRGLSGVDRPDG